MKYKYRIREFDGKFYIEAEVKEVKGILWWRKTITKWKAVDVNGVPCFFVRFGSAGTIDTYKIKLPPFSSLESAQEKVERFVWHELFTKIHQVRNRLITGVPTMPTENFPPMP